MLVAAALSAGAVASTARAAGTSRLVAAAVGGGLFVHLTLTRADYSGVLYSRNITTAVLATAWMLALCVVAVDGVRRAPTRQPPGRSACCSGCACRRS